jgi:formylglycine-generating enzyme required for sulfatase activity
MGHFMKIRNLFALFYCLALFPIAAQTNQPVIFPGDAATPGSRNLVWPATPGLRYEVQQSTNLQSWSTAPGYPAPAFGPAQQMPFSATGTAGFFRVTQLDDQPPVIASQYPADGGFAVPRFSNLTLQLSDATGIDTNSLQLTVGTLGTFTLTNAQLTFSNNLLTFINGGSIPLGAWGTNVTATLVMADTLGHFVTNTWSFALELQPQVVTNLFVFGSPQAQRAGQQVGNIPTRALVKQTGPLPMSSGLPWTLAQVATNYLLLAYTNTAPGFTVGQYVCNLTPVSTNEIFYRKITALSDDPANKQLTLFTVDVPLTEIATNGSASISSDSMFFQTDTNGAFKPAYAKTLSVSGTINFQPIGCSFDGAEFSLQTDTGGLPLVSLTADEMHFWLYPSLRCSMETSWGNLQKLEVIASGKVEAACVFDAQFLLAGIAAEKKLATIHVTGGTVFLGFIGPVPVFIEVGGDFDLKAQAQAYATMKFKGGFRQTMDASVGLQYSAPDTLNWVRDFQLAPTEIITPSADITANGVFQLSLEPKVDALVDALGGIAIGISPNLNLTAQGGITEPLTANLKGEVDLTIQAAGPVLEAAQAALNTEWSFSYPILGPYQLWSWPPAGTVVGSGGTSTVAFAEQPASQTIPVGGNAYFFCTVNSSDTPSYQWYFNGGPMADQTSRTLSLANVTSGYAGNYSVRVTADGQTTNSASATLTVLPASVQSGKSGLIAWYPLNGNANDASGNGNNGTAYHASYTSNQLGQQNAAFNFNGTNSRIAVPDSSVFILTNSLTLAAFIKPGQTQNQYESQIIFRGDGGLAPYSIEMRGNGTVAFMLESDTNNPIALQAPITSNQWHQVAGTLDGNSGQMKLYIDGAVVASTITAIRPFGVLTGANPGLGIGDLQSAYPVGIFTGAIADVRIYNRALADSDILSLYNASLPTPTSSSGMALIPAGSFTMGDNLDGDTSAQPVHSVYVSAFYMDKYDVTYAMWQTVYNWATNHGYSFDYAGSGKALNHPVQTIDWYDCVKWCNARSEMEGKIPAYYTTSAQTVVYRTGQITVDSSWVKWNAGYRLPTEAEWEKAARGGASGQRFPWGNTISWSQANYCASGYTYDVNPTDGYHPTFATGNFPYTSPVGYFGPNGYGLYDMAGNVWQWCWDWYGSYGSASQTDPRGPTLAIYRVFRGGSWNVNGAFYCRSAFRYYYGPSYGNGDVGFRSVIPPGQ